MKRSCRAAAGGMGLMLALLAAALPAQESVKKPETDKPQWQRLLQGQDANKAAEQEKQLLQLVQAGQWTEAIKVAEKLLDLRTRVQGADHWQAINARLDVDTIRRMLRSKKEEQQSYRRALVMESQAEAFMAAGRYREAQPLLEQALAIRRNMLGEENSDTASSYNSTGYNLYLLGKYSEAERGLGKALAIRLKVLGEGHPDTASSYDNVALNLHALAKYKEAEEGSRKALAIFRKTLGEEHPDTATSYSNVAYNLGPQAKYKEAEENFRKALAIQLKVLGEEHPDTARSYNNLSQNLQDQGKLREAEEGLRKTVVLCRKVLGEEHPNTATCYSNLALNLHAQGKYQEADEGYRKALAIRLKVVGEEHPNSALGYYNLASNENAQHKYKEAEKDYRKALAIRRKLLGEEHPHIASSYNGIASNLKAQGKYAEADEGYRKALAIRLKVLGEDNPETAISYTNVALNLHAQGKYQEAEEGLRRALAIFRKVLGEEHYDTVTGYRNLASNLYAEGKYKEAESYFVRAAESFAKARLQVAGTGLERAAYTSEQSPLPPLAAVLARNGKPDEAWQRFEESLARGTWDDLSARLRRPQAEREKQTQITSRIDRLNQRITANTDTAKSTREQRTQRGELLSELRVALDELALFNQQLEKKYGPIAGQVLPRSQIQEALPADAALLAWLDIPVQSQAADPNGEHWAILLRSAGDPVWVRLHGSGEKGAWTDDDTKLPAQLRQALQSSRGLWNPLAQRLRQQRLDPLAQHLKGVRRLIVLPSTAMAGIPIEVIADKYTISYAHSGTMHAHLLRQPAPTGKGLFVLADPVFDASTAVAKAQPLPPAGVLLTVVVPGSNAARAGLKPNDVLLRYGETDLAGPKDFKPQAQSNDPDKRIPVVVWREGHTMKQQVLPGKLGIGIAREPAPQAMAEQRRIDRLVSRSSDEGKWARLPGTRIEAASLQRLVGKDAPVQLLLDSDASEQRLNELAQRGELGNYRYIHLATHGEVNDTFPLRSAVILSRDHLPDDKQRTELLLSGQPIADGRLDAEEALMRWNLHCDLVTLSACETALGKYERGEGFVGFAQSLILCGTRSVCLSLWKVDDTATALLMERFYQNLLGKREGLKAPMTKAKALAEAKTWLRTLPREEAIARAASLTQGVSRGKAAAKLAPLPVPSSTSQEKSGDCPFAHPHYWAAFILMGDPR